MTPDDLLQLMNNALVKTGTLRNATRFGRPESLELVPETFFKGVDTARKEIKVYNLKQTTQKGAGFLSYVCDYKRGELHYQVLDREADFCFTVTMNGCSFGVGAPNADGSVLVSHGNMAFVKDAPDVPSGSSAERQEALAEALHGPNLAILDPRNYRREQESITTFGVRIKDDWKFFYQSYRSIGNQTLEFLGLKPFVSSSLL